MPGELRAEQMRLFRLGERQILVCTDVAARGLDFENISHVVRPSHNKA